MNLFFFGWNWIDVAPNTFHRMLFHFVKAWSNQTLLFFGHSNAIFDCFVKLHGLNVLDETSIFFGVVNKFFSLTMGRYKARVATVSSDESLLYRRNSSRIRAWTGIEFHKTIAIGSRLWSTGAHVKRWALGILKCLVEDVLRSHF